MTTYAVSDLHLGHANIIDYCNRPFTDVQEMDNKLRENWNDTVDEEDVVYFLGDLAMTRDEDEFQAIADRLNGTMLMAAGNHDKAVPDSPTFPVVDSFTVQHGKYRCYCTHRPENVPDDWSHWALTGHHHNNDTSTYPFINTRTNTLNLSVELVDYQPVSLEHLFTIVDAVNRSSRSTLTTIEEAWTLLDD